MIDPTGKAGVSAPVVLVCGFGPGFYDDLARARSLYPDAPAIAVNEASKAVKAFAIFSLHPEKMLRWRALQDLHFGEGYKTHTGGKYCDVPNREKKYPGVDCWWPEANGGGTSVWAAQKMGKLMGFEKRILVGAPLVPGNYADKGFAKAFREGQRRKDGKGEVLEHYRAFIEKDTDWHEGCTSMSGWTREFLG